MTSKGIYEVRSKTALMRRTLTGWQGPDLYSIDDDISHSKAECLTHSKYLTAVDWPNVWCGHSVSE